MDHRIRRSTRRRPLPPLSPSLISPDPGLLCQLTCHATWLHLMTSLSMRTHGACRTPRNTCVDSFGFPGARLFGTWSWQPGPNPNWPTRHLAAPRAATPTVLRPPLATPRLAGQHIVTNTTIRPAPHLARLQLTHAPHFARVQSLFELHKEQFHTNWPYKPCLASTLRRALPCRRRAAAALLHTQRSFTHSAPSRSARSDLHAALVQTFTQRS